MNLEPYRQILEDRELRRELAEAEALVGVLRRRVGQLDIAIENLRDALSAQRGAS